MEISENGMFLNGTFVNEKFLNIPFTKWKWSFLISMNVAQDKNGNDPQTKSESFSGRKLVAKVYFCLCQNAIRSQARFEAVSIFLFADLQKRKPQKQFFCAFAAFTIIFLFFTRNYVLNLIQRLPLSFWTGAAFWRIASAFSAARISCSWRHSSALAFVRVARFYSCLSHSLLLF